MVRVISQLKIIIGFINVLILIPSISVSLKPTFYIAANSFELRFVAAGDGHANLAGFSLEATQRPCGSNQNTGIQAIA